MCQCPTCQLQDSFCRCCEDCESYPCQCPEPCRTCHQRPEQCLCCKKCFQLRTNCQCCQNCQQPKAQCPCCKTCGRPSCVCCRNCQKPDCGVCCTRCLLERTQCKCCDICQSIQQDCTCPVSVPTPVSANTQSKAPPPTFTMSSILEPHEPSNKLQISAENSMITLDKP